MTVPDSAIDVLLAAIETRELRSLQWGYVDGSLAEADVHAMAAAFLPAVADPSELVEAVVERGLIFEWSGAGGFRLRSRFAEGVRLLTNLRQIFPTNSWATAPSLVSDFRVDARPRRFPRRDLPAAAAVTALARGRGWTPLAGRLATALLAPAGRDAYALSAFQLRATAAVLNAAGNRGIVVSSGTGSGKTLAFYLPALIEIGGWVRPDEFWVKGVALYPRIELLKDQFTEAFRLARSLDATLTADGRRPVTLGSFFSLTPRDASAESLRTAKWPERGDGFLCPFLACPLCGDDLAWRRADLSTGVERLRCTRHGCTGTVTDAELRLTRSAARARPPDVLFTTVESLNQRLSDTYNRGLFGVHPDRAKRLRLVLLDEIHTYTGAAGAQAALVLRRWRHALGAPARFMGLSATLREAARFFAELTGLAAERVEEIAPAEEELEARSMAYHLVLRGDPASQTALLSTSIQAGFLLARLLDPPDDGRSGGRFGSRVFIFTDDLDATNRLHDNLRDAEAYDAFGREDPRRRPLAVLRDPGMPQPLQRDVAGQNWRACEAIGRPLGRRLRVSRTTSLDTGVNAASDVVVATAALEVGFDDARVGAVLQHKSPHELAAFVQRKGRAGRTTAMRPWMVTVLSDYGRDRLTFQAYDQLFDPALRPQHLPVRNSYILRMQAVFAFIDWLAVLFDHEHVRAWWWQVLNGPADQVDWIRHPQERLRGRLAALLEGDAALQRSLAEHLRGALGLESDDLVKSLLWEPPRPLLLEVIPTLARRLLTNWQKCPQAEGGPEDLKAPPGPPHPLPDFVPANLFSDLNLPEVRIVVPPAWTGAEEKRYAMPIVQTLNQFVPGRVTRRFAQERGGLHHWVPVPIVTGEYDLPISRFAPEHEPVVTATIADGDGTAALPIYRPWTINLERISERVVAPTSNATLAWSTQLLPAGEPLSFAIADTAGDAGWGAIVERVDAYLHGFRSPLTVRRFARAATARLRIPRQEEEVIVRTRFTLDEGQPAAIGFEQDVDAVAFTLRLPDAAEFARRAAGARGLPAWRTAYVRDRVLGDPALQGVAGVFQRDWLWQVYFSALIARAVRDGVPVAAARESLRSGDPAAAFAEVIDAIFCIPTDDDAEEEAAPRGGARRTGRLRGRLRALLAQPEVLLRLHELAGELWAFDDLAWGGWLVARAHETLAEALLLACTYAAPRQAVTDTLLIDLSSGLPGAPANEVWITESTLGGAGVIESLVREFAADPRVLFSSVEAALAPSDLEVTATGLERFVDLATGDADVAQVIVELRRAEDHDARERARLALHAQLARRGLGVDHSLAVALGHRLLRRGTDAASDALVGDLIAYWRSLEDRLGVAIDQRVFCFLAAIEPAMRLRMETLIAANTGEVPDTGNLVALLAGILWPRPSEVRGRSLDSYSPFRERGRSDPGLVRELLLGSGVETIVYGVDGWAERFAAALARAGSARLAAGRVDEEALHAELFGLLATPVSAEFLQFYPAIDQATRDEAGTTLTFILRELVS